MRFVLRYSSEENTYRLMRKIGYFFKDKSFVRPLRSYPRFHLYLKIENENLIFNLHLDQKKPSYKGVTAHSGEYDGEIVETEAERIKQILQK